MSTGAGPNTQNSADGTLYGLIGLISQATDEANIVKALGEYALRQGAASVILTYFQTDNEGTVAEDVAKWTPEGVVQIAMWWMNTYRLDNAPLAPLWLNANRVLLIGLEGNNIVDASIRQSVQQQYGRTLAILPLKREKPLGVITISWTGTHEFSTEERTIYESLLPTVSAVAFNRLAYFQAETVQRRYAVIAQTNALLGAATSEQEVLDAVGRLTKEYGVGWSTLNYCHYDETGQVARLEVVAMDLGGKSVPWNEIPGGPIRTRQSSPLWDFMLAEQPLFIEDMRIDPRAEAGSTRENAVRARLVAFISLPLRIKDQWLGMVSFGWPEPHIFPAELRDILTVITPTLTAVVANRRLLTQAVSRYEFTEERLRAVVNNAPLLLYSWDRDAKFNLAEGRGLENYDLKPGELVGKSAFDFYKDYPEVLENIKRGLAGESFAAVLNLNNVVYQVWYSPVKDRVGTVTGLISVAFDVTERRHAEIALETAIRQLRESSRFKDEFFAMMSHELRTPLNALIGLLGISLMEGNLGDDDRMLIERARANSDRLLNLINNILDISRMEAGRLDIVNGPVTLRGLISKLKSDVSILAEQKKLELVVDISDSVPQEVLLDQDAITKILTNLVGNAIKFTDHGSVTLKVGTSNEQLLIEVKDTGVGIPAHMQQVIFESFRQVDASPTRRHGGSGLGLAIVHNLCVAQGGSIRVESKPGAGSTFSVVLPLLRAGSAVNSAIVH